MSKAKNGKAVDVKKAAAGDKPESNGNGKSEKAKDVKIQTFTPANTKLVKRGFVKMFVDFVVKRGSATTDELAAEFAGRQVEGKKITKQRVLRYALGFKVPPTSAIMGLGFKPEPTTYTAKWARVEYDRKEQAKKCTDILNPLLAIFDDPDTAQAI